MTRYMVRLLAGVEGVEDLGGRGAEGALLGRAAGQVDAVADRSGDERVAGRRHRAKLGPGIGRGVVAFDLVVDAERAGRVALAAKDVELAVEHGAVAAGAAGGHARARGPGVARGVVLLQEGEIVHWAVAATGDVQAPADTADGEVVAADAHRRQRVPAIGGGIVDGQVGQRLVGERGAGGAGRVWRTAMLAADRVEAVADRRHAEGAARRGQRRPGGPAVGRRVVGPDRVDGLALAEGVTEAADEVDLAIYGGGAGVVDGLGERRAVVPLVGRWVVDLHEGEGLRVVREAAHDVDAPVEHGDGRFLLLVRHRRQGRPRLGWGRRERGRAAPGERRGEQRATEADEERQRPAARRGAVLPRDAATRLVSP